MSNTHEENMSTQASLHVPLDHSGDHHGATKLGPLSWAAIAVGAVIVGLLVYNHIAHVSAHEAAAAEHAAEAGADHGAEAHAKETHPPLWATAPFIAILLSIAILPLVPATQHWWESNRNRLIVALTFGVIALLYYQLAEGFDKVVHVLDHAVCAEYIPFIMLLFSLYVISGGICLRGDLAAHPRTNATFIAVGGLMASFIGTTGAAMLLIRPLLQTNSERRHVTHTVIFFIFVVCNCGGCLLPIGDPPLFLGYLKGVPFLWTLHLTVPWAVTCAAIIAIYYVWDTLAYRHEEKKDIRLDETQRTPLSLTGKINFLWLLGVVLCVGLIDPSKPIPGTGWHPFPFLRELIMLGLVALSLRATPGGIREANKFNYHAILEVAALFIGIFIAMQIPIEILRVKGDTLGLHEPWHFFWATGSLSSFLDNAPTYVVFFETATTLKIPEGVEAIKVAQGTISQTLLVGISLGAVFMGAMTYIGNGPNFMVKSIAEQSGIRMPSFFGYMLYSVCILVPLFVIVTLIFV